MARHWLDAFRGGYRIKGQALFEQVMEQVCLNDFFSVDGYFVLIEHEEENPYTFCFLPASEAPQPIREALNSRGA